MHEFDKVTMMKGLIDLLSLYKEVKPHMADVIDDHKLMPAWWSLLPTILPELPVRLRNLLQIGV